MTLAKNRQEWWRKTTFSTILTNNTLKATTINIEEFREFCLSLGEVEEKLPFAKMPGGESVLVFYVCGHTFCYCDLNDFSAVNLKCQPERIQELRESSDAFCDPDHMSPKYWIGVQVNRVPSTLLKELTQNSFEIVKAKYSKKGKRASQI